MPDCCIRGCERTDQHPEIRISVWPPSDAQPISLRSHLACFDNLRKETVSPDPKSEYGRIPANARCVLCGDPLPRIGVHPYAVQVGDEENHHRFWAHAECIEKHFIDLKMGP